MQRYLTLFDKERAMWPLNNKTSSMKTTLQINRHGTIIIEPHQSSEHQCVKEGHRVYYYRCSVTLNDPMLDSRGFITDHDELHSLVLSTVKTALSCEIMAAEIAKAVSRHLLKEDIRHDHVYVSIAGAEQAPAAFMEAWAYPEKEDYINKPSPYSEEFKPKHRTLTVEEIKALPGFTITERGSWEVRGRYGIIIVEEQGTYTSRALSLREEETYERARGTESHVQIGRVLVPQWAIRPIEPKAPEEFKPKHRILSLAELEQLPGLERVGIWLIKFSQGTISPDDRARWTARELTAEETARYFATKDIGIYLYLPMKDVTASVPFWAIVPIAEEAPKKAHPMRIKTKEEMYAIPGVFTEDGLIRVRNLSVAFNIQPEYDMSPLFGQVLPLDVATEIRNLGQAIWKDALGPRISKNIARWMTTTDPLPIEEPKKLRVRTYESLRSDSDVAKDSDGDLQHDDFDHYFFEEMRDNGVEGLVLDEKQMKGLAKNDQTAVFGIDGETYTIERWMLEEID
jgi:hypothetical protein